MLPEADIAILLLDPAGQTLRIRAAVGFPADLADHLAVGLGEGVTGWRTQAAPVAFFRAKGLVEALLAAVRVDWWAEPGERPFLHPGRSATIVAAQDERKLGWIGEVHPLVAR